VGRPSFTISLKPLYELEERNPDSTADLTELQQIEATLARLVLADERLGLSQLLREIDLTQPGFDAYLSQQP
jgi:hypothetical protein